MRYLTLFALLFAAFFLLILLFLPSQPFDDPGAFWHVRVGEWILDHREFPHTDPFTFSFADRPWIPQQWLAELAMAKLSHIGGFDSLLTTLAALLAGLGAWIGSRFTATGWHPLPAFMIVAGGLAVCTFHLYVRPHIVTLVFMGIIAGLIVETDRGRIGPKHWLMLIPLSILWTNLHGGIVGGLATLCIALAGWYCNVGRSLRDRNFYRCLAIIVLASACTLINPFGLQLHRVWFSLIDSKVLREFVSEHQPITLAKPEGFGVIGFGIFYLVALLGTLPRRPRVSWLIPPVWFVAACQSIRHGPIFCVVALVILADMLPETIWFRWLKAHGDTLIREPREIGPWSRSLLLPSLLVLSCFGLQATKITVPVIGSGWARLDPKSIPLEMVEPLQSYAANRPLGTPIFNDANLGGFVLYFAPTLKIFMDDRCELYGDDWIKTYIEVMTEKPEVFDDWAKKWNFERVILTTNTDFKLDAYLAKHAGWREVNRCKLAVMYERKR